jgi:hypothetical protein
MGKSKLSVCGIDRSLGGYFPAVVSIDRGGSKLTLIHYKHQSVLNIPMSNTTNKMKAGSLFATLLLAGSIGLTACSSDKKTDTTTTTTTTETKTDAPAATTGTTPPKADAPTGAVATGTAMAMSAADKLKLTPVKQALVMVNTAVKGGDMAKAKTQFGKFDTVWKVAEPILKEKAGDKYALIEQGVGMVKTHLVDAKTPDKAKASEGLMGAIKALDAVMK